jgi:APA family basic amino acid/polyamine antiporter
VGGILVCGWLMWNLPRDTWLRLLIWMGIGLAIYFLYSRLHSKLQQAQR